MNLYSIKTNQSFSSYLTQLLNKTTDTQDVLYNISQDFGGQSVYIDKIDTRARNEMILYLYHNKYKELTITTSEIYERIAAEVGTYLYTVGLTAKVNTRICRHIIETRPHNVN